MKNGFTLIELLVVIAIIGILASVVLASLSDARATARDSARIQTIKQLEVALELYRNNNGRYPAFTDGHGLETSCGSQTNNYGHCDRLFLLTTALSPYITIDPTTLSAGTQGNYYFTYSAKASDNYTTYGMMFNLENSQPDDGGFYINSYEAGPLPRYCMNKYTGTNRDWHNTSATSWSNLCRGGN